MNGASQIDRRHSVSRCIRASEDAIYEAFIKPESLVRWLPPEGARGEIRQFDVREGGSFALVLTFAAAPGKSSSHQDVVRGRFLQLVPGKRIVQAIDFVSDRPEFAGTMTMTWSLAPAADGTLVSILAENVPIGIGRTDHELGMASSLENLARFVE
ncbi:SRPBCC domain-containing protein [Bradyrhizobium sp. SZCCHNPS2010]|uniref:SRPBCC domain-containing protein n=1 Tax=Bradyrhizobium sp. SZCCHNPS2010 TaxID=3057333 RepID=UPI0029164B8E|nr:SRPBCC domain-containing protein [Bradyrhizobium sp. SZCCHNPS2010]